MYFFDPAIIIDEKKLKIFYIFQHLKAVMNGRRRHCRMHYVILYVNVLFLHPYNYLFKNINKNNEMYDIHTTLYSHHFLNY